MRRLGLLVIALGLVAGACLNSEPAGPGAKAVVTPNESATPGPALVSLEHWADFDTPVAMRAPAGDDAWYVVNKVGKIWRYDGEHKDLILDIGDEIQTEAEQGLYDFIVSPDGKYAYIHFTGDEQPYGDSHIREYEWNGSDFVGEGREVLVVPDPYPHHQAGQLQFGPDGHLYIAIGDGGVKENQQLEKNGDPHLYARRTDELLGNILRIDPRPKGDKEYSVPKDNPFVGKKGRDEIWVYGLRNPWRFSFDRETGDMYIADVGHRYMEEVDFVPAGSKGGQDFGWSALEGTLPYKGDIPKDSVLPIYEYPHRGGPCALIGGYVYRGEKIDALKGWYVYGDFCTGGLRALKVTDGKVTGQKDLGVKVESLVSLAEDRDGELFAVSLTKGVYRIEPK